MVNNLREIVKNIKHRRIIIIIIFYLLLIVPFFINILFKIYINDFFSAEWSAGDFLTFYGSVLGGGITLFGVIITLKHQEKNNIERDLVKYKPILSIESVESNRPFFGPNRNLIFNNQYGAYAIEDEKNPKFVAQRELFDKSTQSAHVFIKNKGRGETTEAFIKSITISEETLKVFPKIYNGISGKISMGEILVDQIFDLIITLPTYISVAENNGQEFFYITVEILITYGDIFEIQQREYLITFKVKVFLEKEIKPEQSYYFEKEKIFSVRYGDSECFQTTKIINK